MDHAATSQMRPEAREAMIEGMLRWANPSSPHAEGRAARAALEEARERIKAALGWEGHVIFTSGASEALRIALRRAKGGRRWHSSVEHDAVLRAAPGAGVLPVNREWDVDPDAIEDALAAEDRPVIAIQWVNPETGKVQPIELYAPMIEAGGGVFVTDASQLWGLNRFPRRGQMLVISAHKLGGPIGVGALLVGDLGLLEPSGGQEFGYRGGTENLPAVLGFAAAVEAWAAKCDAADADRHQALMDMFRTLETYGAQRLTGYGETVSAISAIAMPNLSAAAQLVRFDLKGFAVSAGSACASGTLKQSRVLEAFGVEPEVAARTIRVSTGWSTTAEEIRRFTDTWIDIAMGAAAKAG
ncbi:cysteine desulfurase family protein [Sphingomonas sp. BT-65]|uniref:cysteine desulfurase family protein n=1 Tax=Sphingomonas sp. BT-65 TaxID=2989821 RepID=UPI00278C7642|nr:aminotransferase class V-fold PLP-dependent enzyme [Sphingomonas sp. BT-65]